LVRKVRFILEKQKERRLVVRRSFFVAKSAGALRR